MLGKLLKHEFRALSRLLIPIHILMLVTCLIGRWVFLTLSEPTNVVDFSIPNALLLIVFVLFIGMLILVPTLTSIIIVVRYYKSLYTDEGYLTLTLPASRGQLLFSKAFAASIWNILDLVLVITGLSITFVVPIVFENRADILRELEIALEMSPALFFWATVIMSAIGCVGNLALYYFSISLGQLFSSHKVIGAIGAYFALSTIISIVSFIALLAFGYNPIFNASTASTTLLATYKASALICAVEIILFFGGTYYLLKRKTNLS